MRPLKPLPALVSDLRDREQHPPGVRRTIAVFCERVGARGVGVAQGLLVVGRPTRRLAPEYIELRPILDTQTVDFVPGQLCA